MFVSNVVRTAPQSAKSTSTLQIYRTCVTFALQIYRTCVTFALQIYRTCVTIALQIYRTCVTFAFQIYRTCVLCGSENKQRLFHCTALTDEFL